MDIKDLTGLGEPLKKLFEVIQSGTGRLTRSYFTKRDADAKAYEIRTIAEALHDTKNLLGTSSYNQEGISMTVEGKTELSLPEHSLEGKVELLLPEPPIKERTQNRIEYQELKRQINLEQISQIAADEIIDQETVSSEPVDEDWISRFFKIAEDVSSEEMQLLWGKVLAGEVAKPKSYSLRTLDLLKNLTKEDAQIFAKVAQAVVSTSQTSYVVKFGNNYDFLEKEFSVTFSDFQTLRELGLLAPNALFYKFYATGEQKEEASIVYGDTCIVLERDPGVPEQILNVEKFTLIGQELLPLIKIKMNFKYVQKIASLLKREGVKVNYGKITSMDNDLIGYEDLGEVPED